MRVRNRLGVILMKGKGGSVDYENDMDENICDFKSILLVSAILNLVQHNRLI